MADTGERWIYPLLNKNDSWAGIAVHFVTCSLPAFPFNMDHFPQLTMSHLIVVASGLLAYVLASRLAARRQSDVHLLPKPVRFIPFQYAIQRSLTLPQQSNAHWLWGHEKLAWESVNSQFQVDAVNELGHIVALKGALFVRLSFSAIPTFLSDQYALYDSIRMS